jgi:hypothetical protein
VLTTGSGVSAAAPVSAVFPFVFWPEAAFHPAKVAAAAACCRNVRRSIVVPQAISLLLLLQSCSLRSWEKAS